MGLALVIMHILEIPTEHVRSPDRGYGYSACYVRSSGDVYSGYDSVYDSYGQADYWWLRSPCLEHDRKNAGYFIFSTGHVFGNWEVTVTDSYGINKLSAYFGIRFLRYNSPCTRSGSYVRFVYPVLASGEIGKYNYTYNSYGD